MIKNTQQRSSHGSKASVIGLVINLILAGIKALAGWLTGSIATTGDALNNLVDSISNMISLASFKLSHRPASKNHPFGYARIEYVLSAVVGGVILTVGTQLIIKSIQGLINPTSITNNLTANLILIFSIIAKLGLFAYFQHTSHKINSTIIKASAIDSLSDALTTGAILLSIFAEIKWGWQIDGLTGLLVGLIIIRNSILIVKQAADKLLGVPPEASVLDLINQHIAKHANPEQAHEFLVHDYGFGQLYISFDLELPPDMGFKQAHRIAQAIEDSALKDNLKLTIHIEPNYNLKS